jgi:hypothetical protein
VGLAAAAIVLGACSHSGSTPTPVSSASPAPILSSEPCPVATGIAYEPDGGAAALTGIQFSQFEATNGNLCVSALPAATPPAVAFSSHVGPFAAAVDGSVALALLENSSGGYSLVQDILGLSAGSIVPASQTYNLATLPTAAPSASPTAFASPLPVLPDAYSVAIIGALSGTTVAAPIGVTVGPSYPGLIAVTSVAFPPLQFGSSILFTGSNATLPRSTIRISYDGTGALVRGPSDLLAFQITTTGNGNYAFGQTAEDNTLGSFGALLRGNGDMAYSPTDATRAVIAGTTSNAGYLTLVTGLPTSITKAQIALPAGAGTPHSVIVSPNGEYAIVGTDAGIVVAQGVNGASLTYVASFAPGSPALTDVSSPTFTACDGKTYHLTNVASVGYSADQRFLVALGQAAGVSCPSGANGSLLAIPFNDTNGSTASPSPTSTPSAGVTPSPNPTMFTQNNYYPPPANGDYLFVR